MLGAEYVVFCTTTQPATHQHRRMLWATHSTNRAPAIPRCSWRALSPRSGVITTSQIYDRYRQKGKY